MGLVHARRIDQKFEGRDKMLEMLEAGRTRLICDICGSKKNVKIKFNADFCSDCIVSHPSEVENYEPGFEV